MKLSNQKYYTLGVLYFLLTFTTHVCAQINAATKPFTRWWWMGSAVDKAGIKYNLEAFQKAGLGGFEITPIYGVKGTEEKYLDFLSKEYLEILDYTCQVGDSLGLKVDMVLGTGWPYGGPHVESKFAATRLALDSLKVLKGEIISHQFKPQKASSKLISVLAYDQNGNFEDLSSKLKGSQLIWTAKENTTIYGVFESKTGQKVKRAAPGGEGFTLDHYSVEALKAYLEPYDTRLKSNIRAIFNDSYEVYGTDFTPNFFEEFLSRRGYDLKPHFNLLIEKVNSPIANSIRSDYRETLSDLLQEFDNEWTNWAHTKGYKTKLQAHGSPGNLLDLYATADIPECETFGSMPFDIPGLRREESDIRPGDADPMMLKFSSSASHMMGKKLTSSETFTWLRDHFKVSLSQCKPELEELFLNGINHVFLHGSTYSPPKAEWPGWKFYAATNFSPQMTIWQDAPALFKYIEKCQTLLQKGEPANDIALYWPMHDSWASYFNGDLFYQYKIHSLQDWLTNTPFYTTGTKLMNDGYSLDFFSDDFLQNATFINDEIRFKGASYKAIVIPPCENMPYATFQKLIELKNAGAKVFFESLPKRTPGYMSRGFEESEMPEVTESLIKSLTENNIKAEQLVQKGLKFIKRRDGENYIYFIVNHTSSYFDGYVSLNQMNSDMTLYDPDSEIWGIAKSKSTNKEVAIRLQLKAGKSIFAISTPQTATQEKWEYYKNAGKPTILSGPYTLTFNSGGPTIPPISKLESLTSWTTLNNEAESFSGTATYSVKFNKPKDKTDAYLLKLPDVRESARIRLNGKDLGTLWSNPFEFKITNLKRKNNHLELVVTNLSANRIRAKELKGEEWKIFHEINMVDMNYKPFNAKAWEPMPSGIIGEIQLIPLKQE